MTRLAALAVLGTTLLVTACGTRTINQVLADPGRYRNQEVKLAGNVTESLSVVGRGAYRLQDRTGQLWIVSDNGVPRQGARVSVKGIVYEGFNLGSVGSRINLPPGVAAGVVLVESSHKAK